MLREATESHLGRSGGMKTIQFYKNGKWNIMHGPMIRSTAFELNYYCKMNYEALKAFIILI